MKTKISINVIIDGFYLIEWICYAITHPHNLGNGPMAHVAFRVVSCGQGYTYSYIQ